MCISTKRESPDQGLTVQIWDQIQSSNKTISESEGDASTEEKEI